MEQLIIKFQTSYGQLIAMKAETKEGYIRGEAGVFFLADGEMVVDHQIVGTQELADAISNEVETVFEQHKKVMKGHTDE